MNQSTSPFSSTDAWVFAALLLSHKPDDVYREDALVSAGDALNHAILSNEEIRHALEIFAQKHLLTITDGHVRFEPEGERIAHEAEGPMDTLIERCKTLLNTL